MLDLRRTLQNDAPLPELSHLTRESIALLLELVHALDERLGAVDATALGQPEWLAVHRPSPSPSGPAIARLPEPTTGSPQGVAGPSAVRSGGGSVAP